MLSCDENGSPGSWFGEVLSLRKWGIAGPSTFNIQPTTRIEATIRFIVNQVETATVDSTTIYSGQFRLNQIKSVTLFNNAGNTRYPFSGKIFSCKIKVGGNLVMDLIPVAKDNIGYFWDLVSERLIANSGSGELIIGPRK